ncbi:Signal transduction histidine kinase [Actinopolymorpha cephalotaxi]|uniref:histidine kinase n=1 Tax=Actinopolymorpha cephalotaxi TaxID=504797 RepID=A0A1I2MBH0_9ACTN|nr:Signal transduction histidine kinase [Actinopolymorpha cephalotaxi]
MGGLFVLAGCVAAFLVSPFVSVPAGVAAGGLVWLLVAGPAYRNTLVPVATAAALVSLAATILIPESLPPSVQWFGLFELAGLLWLIILVVRLAPLWQAVAVGLLTSAAQATMILRAVHGWSLLDQVGSVGFWALGAVCAALGGTYLRSLDGTRERAVREARRTQRLALARDLHDFVAHDISGIVVQAQAARAVAAQRPEAVLEALARIEEAGLAALSSMDRTVHMLHDLEEDVESPSPAYAQDTDRAPAPGVADLPELLDRFAAGGSGPVRLQLPPDLAASVPREIGSTVHRVVVEALTNVRRHAPLSSAVTVTLAREDGDASALTVDITNQPVDPDHTPDHPDAPVDGGDRRGGLGLVGLAERVHALGGTLTAGAYGRAGWRTTAVLPLATGRTGRGDDRGEHQGDYRMTTG